MTSILRMLGVFWQPCPEVSTPARHFERGEGPGDESAKLKPVSRVSTFLHQLQKHLCGKAGSEATKIKKDLFYARIAFPQNETAIFVSIG